MPIRFRCPQCDRMLGIARRKAGTQTACPGCAKVVTVPVQDDHTELDDLDQLLNASPGAVPQPVATARPVPPDERPLFELGDVDAILGLPKPAPEKFDLDDAPRVKPVSGMDALSLGPDAAKIVLTPQRATLLVVGVVVLLGVAFAAGYMLAGK